MISYKTDNMKKYFIQYYFHRYQYFLEEEEVGPVYNKFLVELLYMM